MNTVVAFGERLIAAGESGQQAAVWMSADGLTWTRLAGESDLAVANGVINDLVVAGPGLVAVGAAGTEEGFIDAAVWTSPDGLEWSRVPHDPDVFGGPWIGGMSAVAAGPAGLVAGGYAQPYSQAAVWASADGLEWSLLPQDDPLFGSSTSYASVADVTAFGGGFAAVGYVEDGEIRGAAVWVSPDGFVWSRTVLPAGPGVSLSGVTALAGSLLAVGVDGVAATAAVWSSSDGVEWTRVRDADFGGPGMFDPGRAAMWAVAATDVGVIAVGSIQESGSADGAVWRSADGVSWSRDEAVVFGGRGWQEMYAVTGFRNGVVAVGTDSFLEATAAAAWFIGPATATVPTTTTTSAPAPTTVTPGAPAFLMRCGDVTRPYESPPPITYPHCSWRTITDPYWGVARWELDPAHPPDPSGSVLHILATETGCAGGALPEGREVRSALMTSGDEYVVFVLIEPSALPMDCPGNPSFPMTIDLGRPLGEIRVFEGFLVPPLARYPDE